jgi:hypothetical protein
VALIWVALKPGLSLGCGAEPPPLQGADEDPLSAMGLVDAHALWHAATVPLTYLFYSFILADAKSYIHGGSDK